MSTKAQIKANKQNSQKSTGPQTAKGKAAVSQNAVKHGLFGSETLIKSENQADYDLFSDRLLSELAPVGVVESMLAERFVSLSWRLKRTERMQNQDIDELIEHYITNPLPKQTRFLMCQAQGIPLGDSRGTTGHLQLGRMATYDWSCSRVLERMMVYERRIESSVLKLLHELERLRRMRESKEAEICEASASIRDEDGKCRRSHPQAALEAATRPPAEEEVNLKKQSQFAAELMGISSFAPKDYGNKSRRGPRKNKAKQSQFPTPALPKGTGKRGRQAVHADPGRRKA